jgi:hypothetical protein
MPDNSEAPNRRSFLHQVGVGIGLAGALQGADAPPPVLIDSPKGGFRFRKGGGKYSSGGAVAKEGYEIVHVTFATAPPLAKGFEMIDGFLKAQRRPAQALCGMELRSPKPFTFAAFGELSLAYVSLIEKRGLLIEGSNPIARVNVCPELDPPSEVSIYGFSYTAPQKAPRPTFLAASGELSGEYPQGIMARGDVSPNGLRLKVTRELENLDRAISQMGVSWNGVTNLVVFTVHDIHPILRELLLPRTGAAKNYGIRWYFARPPIQELEIELQIRGCARELMI